MNICNICDQEYKEDRNAFLEDGKVENLWINVIILEPQKQEEMVGVRVAIHLLVTVSKNILA